MALDMNYTPTRLVDITTLTEDQWLDWRKKGIGGSDVAAALNMSPYRTARDLYYDILPTQALSGLRMGQFETVLS